jgi:hypothetical protein
MPIRHSFDAYRVSGCQDPMRAAHRLDSASILGIGHRPRQAARGLPVHPEGNMTPTPHGSAASRLVLASGARHSYFGHDGWAAAAPGLKQIEDATAIRRNLLLAFASVASRWWACLEKDRRMVREFAQSDSRALPGSSGPPRTWLFLVHFNGIAVARGQDHGSARS